MHELKIGSHGVSKLFLIGYLSIGVQLVGILVAESDKLESKNSIAK